MTGRCAYESALSLINERDSNGEFHQDTQDYEKNLPILLELCVAQLWYDDCIVRGVSPKNFRYTSEKIKSLDTELPLHEATASLLPYLLASLLIHEEDLERAEYYRQLFASAESTLVTSFTSCRHTSIEDVYA